MKIFEEGMACGNGEVKTIVPSKLKMLPITRITLMKSVSQNTLVADEKVYQ